MDKLEKLDYNPVMLSLDWLIHWILSPAIGFGTFLMVTLLFALGKSRFRNASNISFVIFTITMLTTSIFLLKINHQSTVDKFSWLSNHFPANQDFILFTIFLLAASLSYYIFIETEITGSVYWLRLGVIGGSTAIILAALADVGYLEFFPLNQNTASSGWISAAYLFSAGLFIFSALFYYLQRYRNFPFFGLTPIILVLGFNLNILLIGSIPITSVTLWLMYLGLTAATIFEGMVSPTANRIEEVEELNRELVEAYSSTLEGWAKALELRDKETSGHSRRVTDLAVELAKALRLSVKDQQDVRFGALLHDIGKMAIPDEILNKPGKLTTGERAIMETHPREGYKLLEHIRYLEAAAKISIYHHEKWDGSGYPEGLAGDDIPLIARLFAIVDVWDAITSNRPYAPAWPIPMARAYIQEEKGKSFDPEIVDVFLRLEQTYKEPKDI